MLVRKTKLKRSFCISQKYSFVSLKCKAFNSEYSCTKIRFLLLLKIRIKVGQGTSPYKYGFKYSDYRRAKYHWVSRKNYKNKLKKKEEVKIDVRGAIDMRAAS